jgi:hypothetical protein
MFNGLKIDIRNSYKQERDQKHSNFEVCDVLKKSEKQQGQWKYGR